MFVSLYWNMLSRNSLCAFFLFAPFSPRIPSPLESCCSNTVSRSVLALVMFREVTWLVLDADIQIWSCATLSRYIPCTQNEAVTDSNTQQLRFGSSRRKPKGFPHLIPRTQFFPGAGFSSNTKFCRFDPSFNHGLITSRQTPARSSGPKVIQVFFRFSFFLAPATAECLQDHTKPKSGFQDAIFNWCIAAKMQLTNSEDELRGRIKTRVQSNQRIAQWEQKFPCGYCP